MLEAQEIRVDPKEYARRKRIHVITVYRRIKSGALIAYQDAPGCRYEIPIRDRVARPNIR